MSSTLSVGCAMMAGVFACTALISAASLPVTAQTHTSKQATTTRVIKIPAPDGAKGFGYSIDYDGQTLVVGAPQTDLNGNRQVGAVYVYDLDSAKPESWKLNAVLTNAATVEYTLMGEEVAVEGDIIITAAPRARVGGLSQAGYVAFWERTASAPLWHRTAITSNIFAGPFANFGHAIDIENGVAYIGAPGADVLDNFGNILGNNTGAVYTHWRLNGAPGAWVTTLGSVINDPLGQFNDEYGSAVAASDRSLLVGASNGDIEVVFSNEGIAYFYEPGSPPEEIHRESAAAETSDLFGHAVALDAKNGNPLIVIGGYNITHQGINGAGGVLIKQRGVGEHMVFASDATEYDYFGLSVAAHRDVVVVGAPNADHEGLTEQGAVYRYAPIGTTIGSIWKQTAKYTVPSSDDGGFLGRSVAVHDGVVIAGANGADNGNGAVYVFVEEVVAPGTRAYLPAVSNQPPLTGILSNNNIVRDISGARIGAVEGTLTQPIGVFIQKSPAPTVPLTNSVVVVGDYFKLGASTLVYSPVDKPFLVGIPVPAGVDVNRLAAAVLVPEDTADKAGHSESAWMPIYGSYDPSTRLFAFTVSQLQPAGVHAVLVSHPNHDLLPFGPAAVLQRANTPATSFDVDCTWMVLPSAACSDANIAALKSQLFAAYTNFRALGFREPALNRGVAAFNEGGEKPALALLNRFYTVYIRPAPCDDKLGQFDPTTRTLNICIDPSKNVDSQVNRTVRHELFHAVQYAYPGLQADFARDIRNWVVEGTAAAAENSTSALLRTQDFDVRDIDHRLHYSHQDDVVAYQTQDFWVYLGQEQGVPLSYLIPIFEAGADLADVDGVMGGNLGGNYWNWAKNQYYEKENTLNGALQGACKAEEQLATRVLVGYGTSDPNEMEWPEKPGTLDRLSSKVYWISIDDNLPTLYAGVTGADSIRYKIYREGAGGCTEVPESSFLEFENLTSADTLIVIVTNTSISGPANYQVRVQRSGELRASGR